MYYIMCCTMPACFNYICTENCMNNLCVCLAQITVYVFILTVRNYYFVAVLSSCTSE